MEPSPAALLPRPTAPSRLAPLAKLPIFVDLKGQPVVLAGGGEPVVWKAELLAAAGAQLRIYAPDPPRDLIALAKRHGDAIALHQRLWRESDLDGARLAIAEEETPEAAARFRAAARARGILANVIDNPNFCDFQFGTIVNRSPVVIGISTDGAAPILGQALRRRIEAVVPPALAAWAEAAKGFRDRLTSLLPGRAERRSFWEAFVDKALTCSVLPQDLTGELEGLVARSSADGSRGQRGEVVIVGAGPGDPELLTLRAMRELQAADVIVYDRLVTPEVLELGRREARRSHVGKEGHGAACRQEDICALLVDLALEGKRVVRLKGGDPAIFGRSGEEVAACGAAGIAVRMVPGVTTASAAAASLNLSLTHRNHAQRLHFITGHDRHGDLPADLDLAALADARTTLVVYMARRTGARLAARLIETGLAADTPVLAVANVSRPDQQTFAATLSDLARGLALPEGKPVILMIGAALRPMSASRLGEVRPEPALLEAVG